MGRRSLAVMAALGLMAPGGCDEGTTGPELASASALLPAPIRLTLPLGEEVRVDGGPLRLTFTRVLEDSRCPVDVTCVWEGNAVVEVEVAAGPGSTTLLTFNSSLDPRSAVWRGIRVTYLELLPLPREGEPLPDDATLQVELEPAAR